MRRKRGKNPQVCVKLRGYLLPPSGPKIMKAPTTKKTAKAASFNLSLSFFLMLLIEDQILIVLLADHGGHIHLIGAAGRALAAMQAIVYDFKALIVFICNKTLVGGAGA